MKLKSFALRLDPASGALDDREMTEFLADKQVLSVHEHFLVHEHTPIWLILVTYREEPRPGERDYRSERRRDWGALLADDERPVYDAVRRWRNERAKREGRPPYLLLTNHHVFDVVRARPETSGALLGIEGIGEAKVRDFGDELPALLRELPVEPDPAPRPDATTDGGGRHPAAGTPDA